MTSQTTELQILDLLRRIYLLLSFMAPGGVMFYIVACYYMFVDRKKN